MTLRTLAENDENPRLEIGDHVGGIDEYSTYRVTYDSGDVTVSGALSVPTAGGPHPGIVLAHGLVDPESYADGSGLPREQDYFARAGYVVLSADLRSSNPGTGPVTALSIDMGATLDVINAVRALASANLPDLDDERMALMGHSMGGTLVLNTMVAQPDLIDAVVAIAPASSDAVDNVHHLSLLAGGSSGSVFAQYGSPEDRPEFWADISPRTFADWAKAPLLIIHGTDDPVTPIGWSEATADAWDGGRSGGRTSAPRGSDHFLQPQWRDAMELAEEFFDEELG